MAKATEAEACACAERLRRVAARSRLPRPSPSPGAAGAALGVAPREAGQARFAAQPATHPVGCSGWHAWALHRPLRIAPQPLLSPPPAAHARLGLAGRGASVLRAPSRPCPPRGASIRASTHAWPRVQPADLPLGQPQPQPRRARPAQPAAR